MDALKQLQVPSSGGRPGSKRNSIIQKKYFIRVYDKTGGYTTLMLFKETTVKDICDKINDKFFYRDNRGFGLFVLKDDGGMCFPCNQN
jgi:hypothetical protein